jgi:hypothetical protein
MASNGKIDSFQDFTQQGFNELLLELQKWFRLREQVRTGGGGALDWEDVGTSGAPYIVQDEGDDLTPRRIINFIGNGVTAVDDAAGTRTNVTISPGPMPKNARYIMARKDLRGVVPGDWQLRYLNFNSSDGAPGGAPNFYTNDLPGGTDYQGIGYIQGQPITGVPPTGTAWQGDHFQTMPGSAYPTFCGVYLEKGIFLLEVVVTLDCLNFTGSPAVYPDYKGLLFFEVTPVTTYPFGLPISGSQRFILNDNIVYGASGSPAGLQTHTATMHMIRTIIVPAQGYWAEVRIAIAQDSGLTSNVSTGGNEVVARLIRLGDTDWPNAYPPYSYS